MIAMTKDKTTIIRDIEEARECSSALRPDLPLEVRIKLMGDRDRAFDRALASLSAAGPSDEEIERIAYEEYPDSDLSQMDAVDAALELSFRKMHRRALVKGLKNYRDHFSAPVPEPLDPTPAEGFSEEHWRALNSWNKGYHKGWLASRYAYEHSAPGSTSEPVAGVLPLSALMEAVAEGMNCADDAGEDPMSWIQSCLSRVRGVSDLMDSERLPSLKLKNLAPAQPKAVPAEAVEHPAALSGEQVEKVMEVVTAWYTLHHEGELWVDQPDTIDLRQRLTSLSS